MERVERITELIKQKTAIDGELKTLKDQIDKETAALKKPRLPRQKKQADLPLPAPAKEEVPKAEAPKTEPVKK
jgi:hypothetical protein